MPTSVSCPSCNRLLRVPEDLLGQLVKCPSCSNTFTARENPPPGRINEQGEIDRREPSRPRDEYEPPPSRRPPPPRRSEYDDDDDRPPRYGSRYDEGGSYRGGRSAARGEVSGPANCLLVVGILAMLLSGLGLLVNLANPGGDFGPGPNEFAGDEDQIAQMAQGVCGAVLGLAWGAVITFGAARMKSLQNYGLAMTACIIAMLPCHGCCLLGLPFGIWALVVLNRPDVREAFQ